MKYIKTFEGKALDNILDKISSGGEETLSAWEKDYLKAYGTPKGDKMDFDMKPELPAAFKNNPNESQFDETEMIEFWGTLDNDEMHEFLTTYKVMPEVRNKDWYKLPDGVKDRFQEFLTKKGYL